MSLNTLHHKLIHTVTLYLYGYIDIHIDTLLEMNLLLCFVRRHCRFTGIGILLYVLYSIEHVLNSTNS